MVAPAVGLKRLALQSLGCISDYLRVQNGAILCLHSVRAHATTKGVFEPLYDLAISAEFLETLVVELRRRGIELLSIEDALQRERWGDGRRFVAFTLDDGYADTFSLAYPIFLRHRVPFTLFLTTGFVDRTLPMWWVVFDTLIRERRFLVMANDRLPTGTADEKIVAYAAAREFVLGLPPDRLPLFFEELFDTNPGTSAREAANAAPLTWAEVQTMTESGLATIGCHTVRHPMLSRIEPQDIVTEIQGSRDRIAEVLGDVPRFFAYPYGGPREIGPAAPGIAAAAGFTAAFVTSRSLLRAGYTTAYAVPRILVGSENLLLLRAHISGLPSALRDVSHRLAKRFPLSAGKHA
jgi:peptidoglycan/xylan/chitin deacetylase (PgdA/CDA1 family)